MEHIPRQRAPVESLRKGLEVLELLSRAPGEDGMPLAEIATRMDYKRTTAHNLLKTLVICGFAVNDGEGRYRLGSKVGRLLRNRNTARPLSPEILQPLVQLAAELNENVVLTTLAGGARRVLARATGQQIVQIDADRFDGEHTLMWEAVTGRVLAAFAAAEELDELVASEGLPGANWQEIATRPALTAALRQLREQGHAESHERTAASLAVPILDGDTLLGAIGIHLPGFRWQEDSREPFLNAMRRTAHRLARLWHE
jgi:DNA-binding IclR family transcriptional regulator